MNGAVLVIGCGSIGLRHLKNLRALGVPDILAVDSRPERLLEAERAGARPVSGLDEALDHGLQAALICTPPNHRLNLAAPLMDAGVSIFLEKPMAITLAEADEILERARRADTVLAVGYNLRFHTGLRELKRLLDDGAIGEPLGIQAEFGQHLLAWRPGSDYRAGYNARAAEGGGVILDGSHEIDYVCWLGGEVTEVTAMADRLSGLDIDTEDIAMLVLRFARGALGQIHLDSLQRAYSRWCKVIGSEGTLVWRYGEGVSLFSAAAGEWRDFPFDPPADQMYSEEVRHFLECVHGEAEPLVTGLDGRRALVVALAAREAATEGRSVRIA